MVDDKDIDRRLMQCGVVGKYTRGGSRKATLHRKGQIEALRKGIAILHVVKDGMVSALAVNSPVESIVNYLPYWLLRLDSLKKRDRQDE